MALEQLLDSKRLPVFDSPRIFDFTSAIDKKEVEKLFSEGSVWRVSDDYEEQLREWYAYEHPDRIFHDSFESEFQVYSEELKNKLPFIYQGKWVYYPWSGTLAHLLDESQFQNVRFSRNRNLITPEEQKKYFDATIGIVGLSVGNSIALALTLSGGGARLKLADFDQLALSNLNRVRGGVHFLGTNKAYIAAMQVYELNPYAHIEVFPDGLNDGNIDSFFRSTHPLDIIIDEVDNLAVKYRIREYAKKYRLPVVMAADNGDNSVVDIERYDQDPRLTPFHGKMGDETYDSLRNMDKRETGRTIGRFIGAENIAKRMQESLLEVGKTLVSWPQLGGAALLNGPVVAYCVRKILNNQAIESERAFVSLDEVLDPSYVSEECKKQREISTERFKKQLGIA